MVNKLITASNSKSFVAFLRQDRSGELEEKPITEMKQWYDEIVKDHRKKSTGSDEPRPAEDAPKLTPKRKSGGGRGSGRGAGGGRGRGAEGAAGAGAPVAKKKKKG